MKSPIKVSKKSTNGTVVAKPQAASNSASNSATAFPVPPPAPVMPDSSETVDLERRRAQLSAKVAELQWDLGGLVYEMATRNRMRPDVLVKRAAALQDADAELGEIERILRMERTGVAALCLTCGAPHSSGAVYCWQCGTSLLEKVAGTSIAASRG
jgi:ribosomal protein L40E